MLSLPIALLIVIPTAFAVTFMVWVFVMFLKASGKRSTAPSLASRRAPRPESPTTDHPSEFRRRVEGPPVASFVAARVTHLPTARFSR
jgi:hypothetical protein